MKINIKDYQKPNPEKLDAVTTGVSIEKRQKSFLEKYNINLSALIRDVLDAIMRDKEIEENKANEKI